MPKKAAPKQTRTRKPQTPEARERMLANLAKARAARSAQPVTETIVPDSDTDFHSSVKIGHKPDCMGHGPEHSNLGLQCVHCKDWMCEKHIFRDGKKPVCQSCKDPETRLNYTELSR
jgi:hypothetical protein